MHRTSHAALLACCLALAGTGCAPAPPAFEGLGAWQAEQLERREAEVSGAARRLRDVPLEAYVAELLATIEPRRAAALRLYLHDDRAPQAELINPAALLLRTGLLRAARDEDELMFVLAHELAHGELDHFAARRSAGWDAQGAELQADAWAAQALVRLGYRPAAGIDLLQRLQPEVAPADRDLVAQRIDALRNSQAATHDSRPHPPDSRVAELTKRYRD
jgi:predicted Zn-dependent protease